MEKRIITVSREFGSGGRSVGKTLAKRLGWKYYDKELVKAVAEKTGFDPRFIEERGEFSVGKSLLSYALAGQGMPGVMNGMSASDFLWCMQREVILKLAEEGGCVIVGRCADYILRERKDVFNVFVHAPMAYRADRIVRLYAHDGEKRVRLGVLMPEDGALRTVSGGDGQYYMYDVYVDMDVTGLWVRGVISTGSRSGVRTRTKSAG